MSYFDSIILGLVQGLTEFIPVSSSAHLIIVREWLGANVSSALAFDAVLQLATILAVLVYFRKDLWNLFMAGLAWICRKEVEQGDKNMILAIIVGTIPAVIAGLLLESYMESIFRSTGLIAVTLVVGSIIFFIAERQSVWIGDVSWKKGLLIGCFQCLALVPGMSRSGMTISGGLFAGLSREAAARFSFLLSFPIIAGSGLKKLLDLSQEGLLSTIGPSLLVGSLVAFAVGLAAIHFLIKFLKSHSLKSFAWYRIVLAMGLLLFFV